TARRRGSDSLQMGRHFTPFLPLCPHPHPALRARAPTRFHGTVGRDGRKVLQGKGGQHGARQPAPSRARTPNTGNGRRYSAPGSRVIDRAIAHGETSTSAVVHRLRRQRAPQEDAMEFGITMFPTDYAIPPHELAMEAEARGFESVWFPEHSHIPTSRKSPWPGGAELPKYYYDSYDPFVAMGAAAVVTKTIKLGTGVCLVVQRDPIHTAKEVSTVDRLSNGRLLFGIGGGWNEEEMADHGTAFATRFKLMRERIEAMKEIWARSKPKYSGELVNFDEMMQWPKPVQKPHPPIIVGGGFPHGARRAIAYA